MLSLNPLSSSDLDFFVEIYTDPEVMQHIGPVFSAQKAIHLFNQFISPNSEHFICVINSDRHQCPLGVIGLIKQHKKPFKFELGVMISESFAHLGFAYHATKKMLQHGFEQLNIPSVVVRCHVENNGANRIAEALGFENLGRVSYSRSENQKITWEINFEQFKAKQRHAG